MSILEIIVVLIKGFLAGICVLFGAILAVEAVVEIVSAMGYGG